jgi:hypothetical protein
METWGILVSFCQTLPSKHKEKTSESRPCHLWTKIAKKISQKRAPRDSDVYPTARMRSPTRGNSCMASSCPRPLPLPSALCPQANQLGVRQTMTPSAAQRSQSESHPPTVLGQKREREIWSISHVASLVGTNTRDSLLLKLTTATTERRLLSAVWSLAAVERHRLTFEPGLQFVTWYSRE